MSKIGSITALALAVAFAGCSEKSPVAPVAASKVDPPLFDASAAAPHAFIVLKDGLCGLVGADANGYLIFGGLGTVTTIVENANRVTLSCGGENLTNLSRSGQAYRGFTCAIILPSGGFVITSDSRGTIAAEGSGSLTCSYTKP